MSIHESFEAMAAKTGASPPQSQMAAFNDKNALSELSDVSNIGKGQTFQSIVANQAGGAPNMAVWNMPTFKSIPKYRGRPFTVWADETAHGGELEPPHVHIKLPEGKVKCWISEGPGRNQVELAETTVPDSKNQQIVAPIIEHLQTYWEKAGNEWNSFVEKNYPQFKDDEKYKVPVSQRGGQ